MGTIAPLGSAKDTNPKSSQIMGKFVSAQLAAAQSQENQSTDGAVSYEVPSQVAYDGHRLNDADQDAVYVDLGKYLLDETLSTLAKDILDSVEDKGTFDYLACQARH